MHVLQAWVALANAFQGYRAAAFSGHDSNVKITRLSGMQTRRTALVPSLGRHLLEDVYYTVLSMSTSFLDIDDTNDLTGDVLMAMCAHIKEHLVFLSDNLRADRLECINGISGIPVRVETSVKARIDDDLKIEYLNNHLGRYLQVDMQDDPIIAEVGKFGDMKVMASKVWGWLPPDEDDDEDDNQDSNSDNGDAGKQAVFEDINVWKDGDDEELGGTENDQKREYNAEDVDTETAQEKYDRGLDEKNDGDNRGWGEVHDTLDADKDSEEQGYDDEDIEWAQGDEGDEDPDADEDAGGQDDGQDELADETSQDDADEDNA